MFRKTAKIIFPGGSLRRRLAARMARKLHIVTMPPPDVAYAEWVERSEPFLWSDRKEDELSYRPLISIVVPVFNAPARHLLPMVYSVVNQESYDNWELLLINASTSLDYIKLAQDCQQIDTRVRCLNIKNKGIAHNTNAGLQHSRGEYIALLDHDDLLSPRALFEVALTLQESKRPQLIYSDEDKLTDSGKYRYDVHFKPDWSPQLFRQVNYLNHLTVIEKKLIDEVGGYREGYEGAQDYDLFLRLVDKKPTIKHIPKVLYHWRAAPTSTASDISTKKHVLSAGERALEDHLARNGQKGKAVAMKEQPGFYNIVYKCEPSVQAAVLLIPTENLDQYTFLVRHVLDSLKNTKIEVKVIVGRTSEELNSGNEKVTIKKIETSDPKECFEAVEGERDVIVLFNAAAVPVDGRWLEDLAGLVLQVPSIGVAAPFLVQPRPNKKIFDAGFVSLNGQEVNLFKGLNYDKHTYFGNTMWSRNVDYLSGRVCVMRGKVFSEYFIKSSTLYDSRQMLNKSPYDKIRADGYEVVTYSQVRMEYRGELSPPPPASKYLSGNLTVKERGIELAKNINVPPAGDNL